ncbi:MAG: hypothetical protein ACRDLT_15225 [Solirubrobacteraceae bacterium]
MDSLVRYRAWIVMGVVLVAAIAAGLLSGHRRGPQGAAVDRPHVSFGSQVHQLGASSDLVYTNGWVARGGAQTIGVYAGARRLNRGDGLFVITRGNRGRQKLARVVVHASGPVTLLRPAIPATEDDAVAETLHFVTANGGTGTLDLSGDGVKLSR